MIRKFQWLLSIQRQLVMDLTFSLAVISSSGMASPGHWSCISRPMQGFGVRVRPSGTVVIQHIVCKDTVDGNILRALKAKDTTQSALIEAVKAVV